MNLKMEAFRELLQRYVAIFRHAWSHRSQTQALARQAHELQFLPAALALQDTPVHPAPRVTMWVLLAVAVFALLWTVFGQVDIVATAHGKIIPNDRSKVVQSFDTAVVRAVHVREGQVVREGQLLIELDGTMETADTERVAAELAAARLQRDRALTLVQAIDTGHPSQFKSLLATFSSGHSVTEQRLIESKYGEFDAQLRRLDAEVARRAAERTTTQQMILKLEQTLPLARQRAEDYRVLLEKNHIARHAFLEKEQALIEAERDLGIQRGKLEEIAASLLEAQRQKEMLAAQTRRTLFEEIQAAELLSYSLQQDLTKAQQRGRRMRMVAPATGTVQQLAVHTIGGVVTEAQPLMVIVPADDALEIEVYLENKDIGFVHAQQPVETKLDTFPFTKYGTVSGTVLHVSSDALQDEQRGLVYTARVQLQRSTLSIDGRDVKLMPGMAATVEIKTGRRRLIEYFLGPLLRYQAESLHER